MAKIQTLADYQSASKRTCPDLGSEQSNILHMQMGIITEIGETIDIFKKKHAYKKDIDLVNLGEELADIMWYVSNHCTFKGANLTGLDIKAVEIAARDSYLNPSSEPVKCSETVNTLSNLLVSILTNKDINYLGYITSIQSICSMWNLDFITILNNNIEKLKVRYPDKFDEEKALNRNLKKERKTLEEK